MFTKTKLADFEMGVPRANCKKGRRAAMSAFSLKNTRIQLGSKLDPGNMSCVFEKIIASGSTKALALELVDTAVFEWVCDREAEMVAQLQQNCGEWFGKEMDMAQARRMIASILRRKVLTVKCAKYVDVHRLDGDGCVRMELADVRANSFCTPVVQFDGLYIAKHHFSCSFTVTALLVGDVRKDTKEEAALSQFVHEVDRDIEDPQVYMSDEASGHSFDTTLHDEYMSTFDVV